ncbi:MAG: DUF3868 domain-containing protein [Paramuribaculum sp.]|nr:DUF3868 domain-containing protein [Paramuribaculum sp.]
MKSKNIFRMILAAAVVSVSLQGAVAQELKQRGEAVEVTCKKSSLVRNYDELTAKMEIDLSNVKVKANQAAVFTPMIVNGEDTLRLPGVGVYGRTRWYQFERSGLRPITGEEEIAIRASKRQGKVNYSQTVDYDSWMNGSTLILQRTDYGCAGCKDPAEYGPIDLANYRVVIYEPNFIFQAAVAEEVKTRELAGRAYVDFPVNLTTIYPDYRRNSTELAKIIATIDSVRNDKDITVKSLSIKGFASPEGPYDNNIRLAKGRTEALKNYVQQLYMFPYGFIQTSYEPEDWEGLREYVVNSTMPSKMGILAIIDSYLAPDPKNAKLEKDYPQEYKFLLETVYPGLRHSDYRIEYTIRGFSDIAEIAEVMRTQPSKLSLNEMYLLASTLVPGTPEYNEVMETAVKMYPTDEVAILNAATAAMQRDDLNQAERYLTRASNTADALYVRGVLAGLQKDYSKAIWYMEQAAAKGHASANGELEKLKLAKQYSK